ncbi:thioesterase family protein, partial [Vibrio fujianensis]
RAARLDEQLKVKSMLIELKKASLTFCQELVNPDGQLLCKALVKVACIDNQKMKPRAIPQSIILELTKSDR